VAEISEKERIKEQEQRIKDLEKEVSRLDKSKSRATGLFRWTNKKLIGIPFKEDLEKDAKETDAVFGKPISLGLVKLTYPETILAVLLALGVSSVYGFFDIYWPVGIVSLFFQIGIFYLSLKLYLKKSLLYAGLLLLILPVATLTYFSITKEFIWVVIYLVVFLLGAIIGYFTSNKEQLVDEESKQEKIKSDNP
jgi:hypothetical protein